MLCAFPYKFLGIYNLYRQMPLRAWSCVQAVGQNAEMGIIASNLDIQNEYNVVFMYKLFLRHRPSEPFILLHRGYTDFGKYLTALRHEQLHVLLRLFLFRLSRPEYYNSWQVSRCLIGK